VDLTVATWFTRTPRCFWSPSG